MSEKKYITSNVIEYKNIKNETFILFDKLKVLNSDQIYTNKDRFLEFLSKQDL